MNFDRDKLYTRIVDINGIYIIVVQTIFFWNHLHAQIMNKPENYFDYLSTKKISVEKYLN
jgi:hypothetical protein